MTVSALISIFPIDGFAGEFDACMGIDIQAASGAPGRKRVRVDIDLLDDVPLCSETIDLAFRALRPLVEGVRESSPVGEGLYEGGMLDQFPSFRDVLRASVYGCGRPFKHIAADLDMTPRQR